MERIRKPFQGVTNIAKFNRHFYLPALIMASTFFILSFIVDDLSGYFILLALLIMLPVFLSLIVSYFVYDVSNLYSFNWLQQFRLNTNSIININAGFDETSALLQQKFKPNTLQVFDFYDEAKHTEISIKRARLAYPSYKDTKKILTSTVPVIVQKANTLFLFFAAHEIRDDNERILFFKNLHSLLEVEGKIIVTEHLRDLNNFAAYNIGFLHFLSYNTWLTTFATAGLAINTTIKITPFVTTFILTKHAIAS